MESLFGKVFILLLSLILPCLLTGLLLGDFLAGLGLVLVLFLWYNMVEGDKNMYTGTWTNDKTDLELTIVKVYYQGGDVVKVKGVLRNKKNGIVYENRNYKLKLEFFSKNHRVDS